MPGTQDYQGKILPRNRQSVKGESAHVRIFALTISQVNPSRDPDDPVVAWGYDGPGAPQHWGSLSDEYATCSEGKRQSPIDIGMCRQVEDASIEFSYTVAATEVRSDGIFFHIDFPPGNALTIGHRVYQLHTAHFHVPSEHHRTGRSYASELHLVHQDAAGNLAVVGQWFALGAPSALVRAVLEVVEAGFTPADGLALDAGSFLPDQPGYYRYDGSKTTPPCDEPVEWYVMRHPKTISADQVDNLMELSGGPNNRPVQPLGGRSVILGVQTA